MRCPYSHCLLSLHALRIQDSGQERVRFIHKMRTLGILTQPAIPFLSQAFREVLTFLYFFSWRYNTVKTSNICFKHDPNSTYMRRAKLNFLENLKRYRKAKRFARLIFGLFTSYLNKMLDGNVVNYAITEN